jgi:hypothetical protein
MANSVTKQVSVFAKEGLRILENELVMTKKVHVDYDKEFSQNVNGFKKGDTISIKRPTDFTVTDGAALSKQDVVEGSTTIVMDTQKHIAVEFTSKELTLDISESGVRERVLKPAMIQLANAVDVSLMGLYAKVPQWAGTPGQTVDSFNDFAKGPLLMDEYGIPQDTRCGVLSPTDHWGLLGSQTALYMQDVAKGAYRMANLGNIGGVDTYMSQNVQSLTTGTRVGTIKVDLSITTSTVTYASVKDTMTQTIHIDGLTNATDTIAAGEVFTIAGVYAVNSVTKATLPFLKQFVVTAAATAAGNEVDLIISPAMIWTGAQQNVAVVGVSDLNDQGVTFLGSASTAYRQNMLFHKNAFAFVSAPLEIPPAVYNGARESYKGINLRLIPFYDQDTDKAGWRFDVLYGVKAIDPRLAVRLSGTS